MEQQPGPAGRRSDFIREFKAFCNPVSPVGNLPYYSNTIAGLQAYCNAGDGVLREQANKPTAANIANFQNTHTISGHHHAELHHHRSST